MPNKHGAWWKLAPKSSAGRNLQWRNAIRALECDRYLANGELELRTDSHENGDGAILNDVYAVPYVDVGHYHTEPELSKLVDELSNLADAALGTTALGTELELGTLTRVDLSVSESTTDTRSYFDPREHFDLWVYGDGLEDATLTLEDAEIDEYGGWAETGDANARVYRGLGRFAFFQRHTGGHYLELSVTADARATVYAAFAMPYHETENFTTDAEAAAIIEPDYAPGEGERMLTTFVMGHQYWPGGAELDTGDRLEMWVQIPHRQVRPESD